MFFTNHFGDNSMRSDEYRLPDNEPKLKVEKNLGLLIWQTEHAVERAMDEALSPIGLRVTQGAALMYLYEQPGLSGAELARRLHLTPQSAATLLANFEAKGWAKRTPHPVHRGFRETVLTESGKAILTKSVKIIERINRAIMENVTDQELAQLFDLMERVLKNARSLNPSNVDL
jgi:DNA-binding MarR family transcriptional regulator